MNWGRDSLSNAAALSALTACVVTPVIGYFIDRLSTRAVMMTGVLILSTSFEEGIGRAQESIDSGMAMEAPISRMIICASIPGYWMPKVLLLRRRHALDQFG